VNGLKKILLAITEEDILRQLKFDLSGKGYYILVARTGERAWKLIRDESPRMILLDSSLPPDGGPALCRQIRKSFSNGQPFVMLLSDQQEGPVFREGLERGADDYVPKSFAHKQISSRLEALMRRNPVDNANNPLTRLPGPAAFKKILKRHIDWQEPFALCVVNLSHFRAYNDFYGFEFGDRAIRKVADILRGMKRNCRRFSLGHLVADRFLLLLNPSDVDRCCQGIIDQFEKVRGSLFTESDLHRGHLVAADKTGRVRRFALLSISIGAVTGAPGDFQHEQEAIDAALWAMCKAKLRWGNHYYIRRDGPNGLAAARNNEDSKKILVVGGDAVTARLLKSKLERRGYEVRTVSGGPSVVEIIRQDPPDLIFVDDRAGAGGYRTASYLKNDLQAAAIPLVLSVSDSSGGRERRAGADGYLVKPYSFQHLMNMLEEHLYPQVHPK
jgi:DNA-binding response OmpR family regulator